jgi:serine/threonine protein kinase
MPDIDPKIEAIILRAIDRSPRERYASAQEMLADLQDPSRVVPRDPTARSNPPLMERIRLPRKVVVPTVLVLVVGALVGLIFATGRAPPRRGRPAPATRSFSNGP